MTGPSFMTALAPTEPQYVIGHCRLCGTTAEGEVADVLALLEDHHRTEHYAPHYGRRRQVPVEFDFTPL